MACVYRMSRPPLPDDADIRLRRLGAFERSLATLPWFAAAGSPLDTSERKDVAAYLTSLGITFQTIQETPKWSDARDTVNRKDFSPQWWKIEEKFRQGLTQQASAVLGEDMLHTRLTRISQNASDLLQGTASVALSRSDIADAGLAKSAAGAASMAVHQAALALANCSGEHPFAAKFRLYQSGHWPLGLYDGVFHIL